MDGDSRNLWQCPKRFCSPLNSFCDHLRLGRRELRPVAVAAADAAAVPEVDAGDCDDEEEGDGGAHCCCNK